MIILTIAYYTKIQALDSEVAKSSSLNVTIYIWGSWFDPALPSFTLFTLSQLRLTVFRKNLLD